MNIYDISKEAGVSIATVSRVLNNSKNVSPKTRAKIQKIIDANNFKATKPGKNRRREKNIGVLCNSLCLSKTATIIEALTQEFNKLGYQIILSCAENLSDQKLALSKLAQLNPTAIIIEGTDFLAYDNTDNNYILQTASDVPIIILNSYLEHSNIHSILCDESSLIFSLTEEFIKQNKKHVLLLFSSLSAYNATIIDSFNHAYFVHNVETKPEQIKLCKRNIEESYKYVTSLIENQKNIDAIIATDDTIAVGAKKALIDSNAENAHSIPVIGMGNTHLSSAYNIPSINCKEQEIVISTINTFKGIVNKTHTPSKVILPSEIIKP